MGYMFYGLKWLWGVRLEITQRTIIEAIQGDTRSLDSRATRYVNRLNVSYSLNV